MLRSIIFDLDGVLIDSEPLMRFAFETCYRQIIGSGTPPTDAYLEHMGESFPRIMKHLRLSQSMWQPYRELCQKHIDRIKLFPGSANVLAWASALPIKCAILTGKDRARTLQILDHFDLRPFFDVVVASDQLCSPKPDPEGILRVLQIFDCPADTAVMVGDSVSDVMCAQRAGVTSIAVTWGIKPERVQTLCQPGFVVHTWKSLLRVLMGLHEGGCAKAGVPAPIERKWRMNSAQG